MVAGRVLCCWFLSAFPRVRPLSGGARGLCLQFLEVDRCQRLSGLCWGVVMSSVIHSSTHSINHLPSIRWCRWELLLSRSSQILAQITPKWETRTCEVEEMQREKTVIQINQASNVHCSYWVFIRAYGGKKDGKHPGLRMVLRRLRQELEIWFIHSFIQPLLSTFVKIPCRVKQWKWKTNDLGDGTEGGREEERKEVLDRKVKTETKRCIYSYHYMKTEWY